MRDRILRTIRMEYEEFWRGIGSAVGTAVFLWLLSVVANLGLSAGEIGLGVGVVFLVITVPILMGNRRRLPFWRRRTEPEKDKEKGADTEMIETTEIGVWGYVKIDGKVRRLFPQEPDLGVARYWPDGKKVKVEFVATDTIDAIIKFYKSPTKIDPDPNLYTSAVEKAALRGGRGFTKEVDTEAGVWFFLASRPRTNWLNPEVRIDVYEWRRVQS